MDHSLKKRTTEVLREVHKVKVVELILHRCTSRDSNRISHNTTNLHIHLQKGSLIKKFIRLRKRGNEGLEDNAYTVIRTITEYPETPRQIKRNK